MPAPGYQRDTFYDPATGETYAWHINHSTESQFGKRRNVQTSSPTGYSGLVMQQSDDEPMVMELSGTILHSVQHDRMIHWFALCASRTIYFTDFTGAPYEVVILEYNPLRLPTLRNPRDASIPLHYWTYTLRMHVVAFLAPPWSQVTP
jgi:hypothetical protein